MRMITDINDDIYDELETDGWYDNECPLDLIPLQSYDLMFDKPRIKCADLTLIERDQIKDNIFNSVNIKIGNFYIKMRKYTGSIDNCKSALFMDIVLYEERVCTFEDRSYQSIALVNVTKDVRFENCKWLNYFRIPMCGRDVPADIVIEIAKLLHFMHHNPAFT